MKITLTIPGRRVKPKLRTKGKGTARAQLAARDPKRGVTPLGGGSMGFLTQRQYKAAKRVWPG